MPLATLAALATGLGACGGGDEVLNAEAAAPVVTTATTTTTTPTTTTTMVDFNRPVVQGSAPLDPDAGPSDVADLVREIRGQSNDVDAQVRRLAPFVDLDEPDVAQIMDIAVALAPEADGGHPSTSRVRFRSPRPGSALAKALNDNLRAEGWFNADGGTNLEDVGGMVDMVYRQPGTDGDLLELRVTISEQPGATVADLEYSVLATDHEASPDEGDTYFERLTGWDRDLPMPRAAGLVEVAIETSPTAGALTLRYLMAADDEAEAVAAVVRAIGRDGYQLPGPTGEAPTEGPLRLIDETGSIAVIEFGATSEPEIMELEAIVSFDMTPLD